MKILIIAPRSRTLIGFRGDMIKEMVMRGHEVVAIGPEAGFEEEIAALGARFILLPFNKNSMGLLHDYRYYQNLLDIINTERPNYVFNYTIKPVIYGTFAARKANVPKIYSMISGLGSIYSSENGMRNKLLQLVTDNLYRLAFKSCDKVFFQNPDDIAEFNDRGILKNNKGILINGSGINMKQFTPAPLPDGPVFLMVSRILREIGVLEYLEASRIVKKECPEARMQFLGPFDTKVSALTMDHLRPYIDEGTIEYLGFAKDVRPYIAASLVFVLPSNYREGVPHSILEAMSMGRAIITTDGPGCRETVIDGMNGFLIPTKSIDALAAKMIWMVRNRARVEQMATESLRICREKFDVDKVNQVILDTMKLS